MMNNLAGIGQSQSGLVGKMTPSVPQPRLVRAAHEFEAQMMKELMAPLQTGKDILGGEDEETGSASALGSFASEALGKAISEHGGFGIASSILHQMSQSATNSTGRNSVKTPGIRGIPE